MAFSDILRKAFPFLSVAAGLGGPLGTMAANAVGKALGVDKLDPTKTLDTISDAFANPEQRAAITKAEDDFQAQMAQLGYQNAEDLEAIAEADRDSARKREVAVRDYTPEIGFYGLVGVFTYMVHYLVRYPVPSDNKAIIYTMVGTIGTLLVGAANYFYGTTRGSENKGAEIAKLATTATTAAVKKI